jgi:hypothetical protein
MWSDWFRSVFDSEINLAIGLGSLGVAIGLFALSQIVLIGVLVAIPADFFSRQALVSPTPRRGLTALRWAIRIGKNAAGAVILLLGILLSLPGIPGPGLVLIIVGIALLDFPGKRQLLYRLISHPRVFKSINSLRSRIGRPDMIMSNPAKVLAVPSKT